MDQITIRLPEGLIAELDDEAKNGQYDSRAERIRDVLESRTEVDELRQEVKRLRRERRQILEQRTENQELVSFADQQRSVLERQEARRFRPIWTRAFRWIIGESIDRA
jgi:Arc/MetJ-type ribon-helix-helix transcriptional regulator